MLSSPWTWSADVDLGLKGRVAAVTGAGAGIGRAVAIALSREGARVVLIARRRDRLEFLAAELEQSRAPAPIVLAGDVRDSWTLERLRRIADDPDGVHILVNNAGRSHPVELGSDDREWNAALDVEFLAARRLAEAVVPSMRRGSWGRIVNVTGMGSTEPSGLNAGAAAKAALAAWSKGLSIQVATDGITVNCVSPGRIMSEQVVTRLHPTKTGREAYARAHIPMGRFGEPEEVGHVVAFLASEPAGYVTGQTLSIDGGLQRAAF